MQVTSNSYSYNRQLSSSQSKTQKSEEVSFSSMLAKEVKKSEDDKMTFLEFVDQYNIFDSLSFEDKKIFREILKDDKITMSEIDSLSYEQAEKFEKYAFPPAWLPKDELLKSPIVYMPNQAIAMLDVTKMTNNRTFNESLYRTAREINNDDERMLIIGEVQMNVAQAHFGYELMPSFYVEAQTKNQWKWDYDNMNIDFNKFLNDIISMHEKAIANPKTHPQVLNQHQEILNGYNIIQKHYHNIKNEDINKLKINEILE